MGDRIFVQNMHGMIHTELRTFIQHLLVYVIYIIKKTSVQVYGHIMLKTPVLV